MATAEELKKGDKIRIKKGTELKTTHPKGNRVAGRTYTVTVFDTDPYVPASMGFPEWAAKVSWVGAGGYWFWTDPANVEKVLSKEEERERRLFGETPAYTAYQATVLHANGYSNLAANFWRKAFERIGAVK